MGRLLLHRLAYSVFVLWGALTIVFVVVRLVPGDPAQMILGSQGTPAEVAALRHQMGLDRPLPIQYARYIERAVRLNFGASLTLGMPATQAVLQRLPATALLAVSAMALGIVLSLPLGMLAAIYQHSPIDRAVSVMSLLGQSVPNFWLGIMFILVFARRFQLLPSSGIGGWNHLVLPALTLALPLLGILTRLVRSGLLEVLGDDYVRTAYAKGLAPRVVIFRHALRNALIPVITVAGLQFGALLGGAVIVETVFGWPGAGRLLIDAIENRDYSVIQAAILYITAGFVLLNLLVDLSYGYLDPRIRFR